MKAYKVELLIVDFDELGGNSIKEVLENTNYPNHCISPNVKNIIEVDIGGWSDAHFLNKKDTSDSEYVKLFT